MATQAEKGGRDGPGGTAAGFPQVFYLGYRHSKFFPLWALARYRNLKKTDARVAGVGM